MRDKNKFWSFLLDCLAATNVGKIVNLEFFNCSQVDCGMQETALLCRTICQENVTNEDLFPSGKANHMWSNYSLYSWFYFKQLYELQIL